MRRLVKCWAVVVVAVVLALALAACGDDDDSGGGGQAADTQSTPTPSVSWRSSTQTTRLLEQPLRRCAVVAMMQAVHLWNLDDASGRERRDGS